MKQGIKCEEAHNEIGSLEKTSAAHARHVRGPVATPGLMASFNNTFSVEF